MVRAQDPAADAPRRQVLCGIALAAVGLPAAAVLAGCGSGADNPSSGGSTSSGGGPGGTLVALAQVPVGGGTVVQGQDGPVVVVRPTAGDVKAFSAACTHQGTTVGAPRDGTLTCPNHGSQFKASDGSVLRGPARNPLRAIAVKVSGADVVLT